MIFKSRKWGWYLTILWLLRWKIKILYFNGEENLSLQRHYFRKEKWVFLCGNGIFLLGRKPQSLISMSVSGGTTIHVDAERWHQYLPRRRTIVLEIQSGKCREGDIERA